MSATLRRLFPNASPSLELVDGWRGGVLKKEKKKRDVPLWSDWLHDDANDRTRLAANGLTPRLLGILVPRKKERDVDRPKASAVKLVPQAIITLVCLVDFEPHGVVSALWVQILSGRKRLPCFVRTKNKRKEKRES